MRKCGWDPATETFEGGAVRPYELFDRFGLALGSAPAEPDPDVGALHLLEMPGLSTDAWKRPRPGFRLKPRPTTGGSKPFSATRGCASAFSDCDWGMNCSAIHPTS